MRRQLITFDDVGPNHKLYHQSTPRKWTTISAPKSTDSLTYVSGKSFHRPTSSEMLQWIGKRIIYWNGEGVKNYVANQSEKNSVNEVRIAALTRPYIYRILYVDNKGGLRSKPSDDYQPRRLNILVRPDDSIMDLLYF
jgi:hypothetical protein